MGSKKILKEMFKLITEKTDESIEENKFNQSILSSMKVKTPKEINEVLNELLVMLQEGNEEIGKVSNGTFVCYPDIIKKKEAIVIRKLETENLYVEKNTEATIGTENDIKDNDDDNNNKTESIGALLKSFDDLDDTQFEMLVENLGEMSSSQLDDFIEKHAASQEDLVKDGIKDEDEIEREKTEIRIVNAAKGKDFCAKIIAETLLIIDNKETSEEYLIEKFEFLKAFLANNELSAEAQKLCDEVGIHEIIASLEQQMSTDKASGRPNAQKPSNQYDMDGKKYNLVNTRITDIQEYVKASRGVINQYNLIKKGTLVQDIYDSNLRTETNDQQLEQLIKQFESKKFKIAKGSRGIFSREGRRKIAAMEITSKSEEDLTHDEKISVRKAIGRPKPKAARYVSSFAIEANRLSLKGKKIQYNIKRDYISDIEFDGIYERIAVPIEVDPYKKITGNKTFPKTRKRPDVGKIEIHPSRPIFDKIERIKAFLASKSGKKQMEDASKMLFGLIAEKEEPMSEASFDIRNSIKNTNRVQDNGSDEGQIPDDY